MDLKIKVTDDKEWAAKIYQAIKNNDGYCPCQPIKSPKTKCVCEDFLKQDIGVCHCGLYIKVKH